jgi:hypothetical protein
MAKNIIDTLKSVKQCETLEKNALKRDDSQLAIEARRKAIEIQAESHDANTEVEREGIKAIYTYERYLKEKNGKATKATRTWQMIKRYGIMEAIERAVTRAQDTLGYTSLVKMGLQDYSFEAVVLRYPNEFSEEAVKFSKSRIN